jgi:uncharacterized protein (TIGR00730 family)
MSAPFRCVCVFCGSTAGARPAYTAAAAATGKVLAARGISLITGGGRFGMMGALTDAALAGGVEVRGIIPGFLKDLESSHRKLTHTEVVGSMHDRKARMAELSDAFLVLPGALGTLEETFEIATWTQLGLHRKPLGILDVEGYYEPLLAFLDRTVSEGFLHPVNRSLFLHDTDLERLLDAMAKWEAPPVEKWLDKGRT